MSRSEIFKDISLQRRSIRAYLPEMVQQVILDEIFDNSLRAPSNCNEQP